MMLFQACIGLILECIEASSQHGFTCRIHGEGILWLFPRVGAMTLDTLERVKYFGLRSVSYCGICRNRCGRSCTRLSTCHNPKEIEDNYKLANMPSRMGGRRKRAREQLHRHGLDWTKRCRLHESARRCLVHVDKWSPRLFGGLVRYERMHVYFINYCSYTMELIIKSIKPKHYPFIQRQIKACQQFRDPVTGTAHPRLPYLLKMTHLTAERRVRAIFYWAQVLGLKAEVIDQPISFFYSRCVYTHTFCTYTHSTYTRTGVCIHTSFELVSCLCFRCVYTHAFSCIHTKHR